MFFFALFAPLREAFYEQKRFVNVVPNIGFSDGVGRASPFDVLSLERNPMNTDQQTRLSGEILASIALLDRGSESVRAVLNNEENRFSRALEDLQRLATEENIPLAIVGGLAAIRYGYPAATQDIDIAVARAQLDAFLQAAPKYGFKVVWQAKSGWHTLTHGDVEINIVPEGGKAKNSAPTTIPSPVQLGVLRGLDYASLPGWIELKLSFGRQKDKAHVVEAMKKAGPEDVRSVREHLTRVHPTYLALFDQLLAEAEEEKAQEGERGVKE